MSSSFASRRRLGKLRSLACVLALGCGAGVPARFPNEPVLWNDPDRHLFGPPPEESFSSALSDGFDKTVLRPISQLVRVQGTTEAQNINTLDEVPDSSWFTNRLGRYAFSPGALVQGPCETPAPEELGPWKVTSSKTYGATPGFVVRDPRGQAYLLKLDMPAQGPRSSAADAIVSRLYHAAGYNAPCNRVVFFSRRQLQVTEDAQGTDWLGNKSPLSDADLDQLLSRAWRLPDGRYRGVISQWLPGRSLGPWQFEGTRDDDPNDIVPHDARRELRGLRLLAAWVAHKDQREENTLASYMPVGELGWVRHSFIDFGDSLGHFSPPPPLARRLAGHAYGFDLGQITADLLTLGIIHRPFEDEEFGPSGAVFGYYGVPRFDPEHWKTTFPNPAFQRMTERDGAWMARILASLDRQQLAAIIRTGRMGEPALSHELERIMWGRREKILRRYLSRLSPLAYPELDMDRDGPELCVRDLWLRAELSTTGTHSARLDPEHEDQALVVRRRGERVCAVLSQWSVLSARRYHIVEFRVSYPHATPGPLRVHLHLPERGANRYEDAAGLDAWRILGLERPCPT